MGEERSNLPPNRMREAMAAITAARQHPETPAPCPVCSTPGLRIVDQSARPHAEWYALTCASCGLADTIHIPLGPPPGSFA